MKKELMIVALFVVVGLLGVNNLAQGAAEKPVELKIMHFASTGHIIHKEVFVPWAKMVDERTAGRVKVSIFPGELLGKVKDTYDTVVAGTADIGWAFIPATPGRFPLHSVYDLPLLYPNAKVGSHIMWEMFEKEPSMKAEFREVKVLWLHSVTPMLLHTIKRPIRTLADLKGMKTRIGGGTTPASALKALGAAPVVLPTPDIYVSLERGTIGGVVTSWENLIAFKLEEVTKFHTAIGLWAGEFYTVMNLKKWESLPPDIQKILESLSGAWAVDLAGRVWDKADMEALEKVKKLGGHEIINPSTEEVVRWRERIKPVHDEWVADSQAKGLPGKKILDQIFGLADKYSK